MANGTELTRSQEALTPPNREDLDERARENGDGAVAPQSFAGEAEEGERGSRTRTGTVRGEGTRATKTTGRRTKAGLVIASLNVSGRGNLTGTTNNKWNSINQMMREKKIGILCIQETHLSTDHIDTIHALYGRRLMILNSSPSGRRGTSAHGVAFVLNREIIDTAGVVLTEIIPGRAASLDMHWHADMRLNLLNIYAPNDVAENTAFWTTLQDKYSGRRLKKPDVMAGDFNVVEAAADRLPARTDNDGQVQALKSLTRQLNLHDGWRLTEPDTLDYTFPQRGSPQRSRLDRIYTKDTILKASAVWTIETTGVPTDHRLITAHISAEGAPYIGKGRWTMPLHLLNDEKLMAEIASLGRQTLGEIEDIQTRERRSTEQNAQRLHQHFKEEVVKLAQKRLKVKIPKLKHTIAKLQKQITTLQEDAEFGTTLSLQEETALLQSRVLQLEQKRYAQTRLATTANYALKGERPSKYWSEVNKERKPRDVTYSLQHPTSNPPKYEKRSNRMAELTRDYHERLQDDPDKARPTGAHGRACQEALEGLPELDEEKRTILETSVTAEDINEALKKAQHQKAAGLDGLPYEFWQALITRNNQRPDQDEAFDCRKLLLRVYNDIEENGMEEGCHFTDGWMCPIYKKGDRRNMANYRPITLLNTNYKMYTRILAAKLSRVAGDIIHHNQAGFMTGRRIEDQTQTCRVLIDYAEATEEDGVIVALDQEKAYDRIDHDYLWKALEKQGLPVAFIEKVKQLYRHATTRVAVNGEMSTPFCITRGVRQGDPLSCLLFNLAIEPLAHRLRASNLVGYEIPGAMERLITALFADDTSAFLSKQDSWRELWKILDLWCAASRARFNGKKTEVVPVGRKAYRDRVVAERTLNPANPEDRIPENVHIAKDGEPVRILGAWIGNETDDVAVWEPTVKKIKDFLSRWSKCRPTLTGKKHIVQMGPGGMSQYLTKVQGMPKQTEKEIVSMIREFIWGGPSVPPISMDTLYLPTTQGGIGLLSLERRNEAIQIMWLKRYLTLDSTRPTWAYAMDALIARSATGKAGEIRPAAQINTFLQSWDANVCARSSLPSYVKNMLKVAKKHRVSLESIKLDRELKGKLPLWYHLGAEKQLRRLNNTPISDCLRKHHGVITLTDLLNAIRGQGGCAAPQYDKAKATDSCKCDDCRRLRTRGCKHPRRCRQAADRLIHLVLPKWNPNDTTPGDGLTLTTRRKDMNSVAADERKHTTFDPTVTERGDISEIFRVFVEDSTLSQPPALRPARGRIVDDEETTVWLFSVGGATPRNPPNAERSRTGYMAYFGRGDQRNALVTAATDARGDTDISGILAAALYAVEQIPRDVPLHLCAIGKALQTLLGDRLKIWEAQGWIGVPRAPHIRALAAKLRQRCAITTLGNLHSEEDKSKITEARTEAETAREEDLPQKCTPDLTVEKRFNLTGAKLTTMTQALAYKGISGSKPRTTRPTTERNIARMMIHLENEGLTPSTSRLWANIHHKDVRRQVGDFLWKATHGALKIGTFWTKVRGLEDRATCPRCGDQETLHHILSQCRARGQEVIWNDVSRLWIKTGLDWTYPTEDAVLTVAQKVWVTPETKKKRNGATRLWRILVSEAAYAIWKIRCERVIGHADEEGWEHSEAAVLGLWRKQLTDRLQIDMEQTRRKYGLKTSIKDTVLSTWTPILHDIGALPHDWTRLTGFLVGRAPTVRIDFGRGN